MRTTSGILLVVLVAGLASFGVSYAMPRGQSLNTQSVRAMSLGDAWWDPQTNWSSPGSYFETEILLDSTYQEIGAFSRTIDYDESIVKAVSWSQDGSADITVNFNEPGKVYFNGFNEYGFPKVSGTSHIRVITIRWLALSPGIAGLSLTVEQLGTTYGSEFDGWGRSAAVVVQ